MLALKKHFNLSLPISLTASQHLRLSPVVDEPDELIEDINSQSVTHDDTWALTPTPDTEELDKFWTGVEQDITHDPDWIDMNSTD